MAIVKMNKITIIGLEKHQEQILDNLMKLGVVEIVNIQHKASMEEWSQLVVKDGLEEEVLELDNDISKVKSAISHLSDYSKNKKALFEPKRKVQHSEFNEIVHNQKKVWDVVGKIGEYDGILSSLKSEENRLRNVIASLEPWRNLTIPVDITNTKTTEIIMGVTPAIVDINALEEELKGAAQQAYLKVVNQDKDQHYFYIIYHKTLKEKLTDSLKKYGFTKVFFKDIKGTVDNNIKIFKTRLDKIEEDRKKAVGSIAALAHSKEDMEVLHDYLEMKRDRKKAQGNMVKTDKVFIAEGWVPEQLSKKVQKSVTRQWDTVVEIREPEDGEEFPVLLENNKFVKTFELITELYSLPKSRGIDPNLFMAPFYFVFFGLMVSDAGYGLIMALVTGIILLRFKLEGTIYKLMKLIFFGGISTFLWGIMFGGWFGNIVQAVTIGKYEIPPLWFNPMDDPMRLLMWSLIFGGVHLFVGMGLNGYILIKNGKILDAIFDIGFWYVFLIGLALMIVGGASGTIGSNMAVAGAILLVATQGRTQKGIAKKLFSGILSLYNVTGYLSDILSYSRLLALGLATGVIASVVNTVGILFGFNIIGILIFIVIFIVGHLFNILINSLGAYVHASRLQYVEFFGKFYEGGGKAFKPFKMKTKYINLN